MSVAEPLAPRLCGSDRTPRAIRDEARLQLCHGRHLLKHEAAGWALYCVQISEPNINRGWRLTEDKAGQLSLPNGLDQ